MSEQREYWNPERETMSLDEIRELQNEKLTRRINTAYHNAPIIRELWDDAGVSPEDIETVDDLAAAPIFRKDDSRQRMIDAGADDPYGGRLCVSLSELAESGALTSTSSGTTGTPTNVIVSQRDQEISNECVARYLWEMGLRPGDDYLNLAVPAHLGTYSLTGAATKIGAFATHVNHDPNEAYRIAHVLQYLEPTVVRMFSAGLVDAFEAYMADNDLNPREVWASVESIGIGGEPLAPQERSRIEDEWGIEFYENFGSLEPHWYPTECREHGRWFHIPDDHFFAEVRDPDTGERLEDGERGELIVTALSYETMAHICWAHDDIVEIQRGTCGCGRTGTRVKVLGRIGDLVTVAGKKLLPWDVLLAIEDVEEMPGNLFQFYPDSEDDLRLRVGYDVDETDDVDALIEEVETIVEDEVGVPATVVDTMSEPELSQIGPPHKIPRIVND